MPDDIQAPVPVWMLATEAVHLPLIGDGGPMTPARLAELRTALAALADSPIATLEVHPLPEKPDPDTGILHKPSSPLARYLSELIEQTIGTGPSAEATGNNGETLYRLVMPAKFAAQFGGGQVRPVASADGSSRRRGRRAKSSEAIAGRAGFKPVAAQAALAGVGGGTPLAVAAPLMLMAVAAALLAYELQQVKQSVDRVADLVEKLREDKLEDERIRLEGSIDAVELATAVVLDGGPIGEALGLSPAVDSINNSIAAARRRLERWRQTLDALPDDTVEIATLTKAFPGVDKPGGEFRAHLELASLAIGLKRRVTVLQAVAQSQDDRPNPYTGFLRALGANQKKVDELEAGITDVLQRLSALRLTRPRGMIDVIFTPGEVDDLLGAAYRLRELGDHGVNAPGGEDIAIDIARSPDGSIVVFPPVSAT